MFVDYLVTGIPGVGYGDVCKGRFEVVSGGRDQLSNAGRSALLHDKAELHSSSAGFTHRRPDIALTPCAIFQQGLHNQEQRRIAEAHGNGIPGV
jgi:hypothetical protein